MAYYLDPGFLGGPDQFYFDITVSMPIDQVKAGLPVPEEAIRLPIRVTTPQSRVPDLMFFQHYYCGVSAAALELLNEFAPDDIEAIPIDIVDKNNAAIAAEYFYLNVLAFRDALILDESNCKFLDVRLPNADGTVSTVKNRRIDYAKLKMKKAEIRGAHIWHERFPGWSAQYLLFTSDTLIAAAKERQLTSIIHEAIRFQAMSG